MEVLISYGSKTHAIKELYKIKDGKLTMKPNPRAVCGYVGYANQVGEASRVTCKTCLNKIEKENTK